MTTRTNSKLFQNVREKASLAYTAGSNYLRQKNNIFIRLGIEIKNYQKAQDIIKKQLEDMKSGEFSKEDFENAKTTIISTIDFIPDEQDTQISYYFGQELSGEIVTLEEYKKKVETITKEQVVELANKIKITYEGNTKVAYMTYRWDNEEETKIDINNTTIDEEIEAIKGLHELTIIVVDENNNTDTKVQKINGVSKPKISISVDEQEKHFVIKLSDDEKLSKFEFILNEETNQVYELSLEEMDLKELEYTLPDGLELQNGENKIKVKVYNSEGVTEEKEESFVKQ